jgi:hypothetical protein
MYRRPDPFVIRAATETLESKHTLVLTSAHEFSDILGVPPTASCLVLSTQHCFGMDSRASHLHMFEQQSVSSESFDRAQSSSPNTVIECGLTT